MSEYLLALGHNITPTVALDPQPRTLGMQYGRRSYALSGAIIDENPFVELEYSALEDGDMYVSLLTQCGLLVAKFALVSVQVQDENYDWVYRNGVIVKPQLGVDGQRENYQFTDFSFLVHSLRVQA